MDPRDVCMGGSLKSTPIDASTHVHDVSNVARVRVSTTTTLPSPCLRAFLAGNTAHLHHPREETPTVWTSLRPRFRWGARQRGSSGIETEDRPGSIGEPLPIETGENSGLFRIGEETCAWTCHTRCCRRRIGMKLTLKTVAGKQFQVEAEAEETVRGPFAAGARRRSECTRRSVAAEGLGRPRRSLDRRNGVGATLTRQTCRWLKSSRRCKTCKEMRCLKKGKS